MQDIPNLPAALRLQAASDPESPCLFWPQGWDWRWWSWRQVAELAVQWSLPLAGLPAAGGVAFAGDSYPQAVPLDLAVQMAGLTPVPLALGRGGGGVPGAGAEARPLAAGAPPGCVAWAEAVGEQVRVTRVGEAVGGHLGIAGIDEAAGREIRAASGGEAAGGAEVAVYSPGELVVLAARDAAWRGGSTGDGWCRLSPAVLLAAAARIESAVAATAGRRRDSRDREVLVAGWPLGRWEGRLFGAWALVSGAALVLEPNPERRPGAVLWARPTVFYGSGDELAALRLRAAARRGVRRWGRLRTLFQDGQPDAADAGFWAERGARLLRLPAPDDGGGVWQGSVPQP